MRRTPLFLPVFIPLLVLVWAFSIAGLSIAASLIATYHNDFAGSLGAWTKALLAAFCFAAFCASVILLGIWFAPRLLGNPLLNSVIWTIVWLMSLVCASGLVVARNHNSCSRVRCNAFGTRCVRTHCGLFRSEESIAWVVCWLSFFLLLSVIVSWIARDNDTQQTQTPATEAPAPPSYAAGGGPQTIANAEQGQQQPQMTQASAVA